MREKIKLLQAKITMKRNDRVNDYLSKTVRMIINYERMLITLSMWL